MIQALDAILILRTSGLLLLTAMMAGASADRIEADRFQLQRDGMIRAIETDVRETRQRIGKGRLNPAVMVAMNAVPRHAFVPHDLEPFAYANRPLPIGYGQTISQPYIVALMTDLMEVRPQSIVLEVGTGSGYQAAVLSKLVKQVYTVEIIPPLEKAARHRLERLGYLNIETAIRDGYYGWEEHGPFDSIIVTAAAKEVPPPLVRQLKPGGRMLIPVGSPFMTQHLILIEKDMAGGITTRQILPVRFVPLTGSR